MIDMALTIKVLYNHRMKTMKEIAEQLQISRASAYRYLDLLKDDEKAAELINKVNPNTA